MDTLRSPDKVVSTALMRSSSSEVHGARLCRGRGNPGGPGSHEGSWSRVGDARGLAHSSPRDGHEETHVAKRRHIPGPRGQGKEKERALGPLEGCPRSLKDSHVGGREPQHHPHRSFPILTAGTDSNQPMEQTWSSVSIRAPGSPLPPVLVVFTNGTKADLGELKAVDKQHRVPFRGASPQ